MLFLVGKYFLNTTVSTPLLSIYTLLLITTDLFLIHYDSREELIQKFRRINIYGNDELHESEFQEWHQFLISLKCVNNVNICRGIIIKILEMVEINDFADAPEHCYGAVVYCKSGFLTL